MGPLYDDVLVSQAQELSDKMSFFDKLRLAWAVLRSKHSITLQSSVYARVDSARGLYMSTWVRNPGEKWKHWAVGFDGIHPAEGYVDGQKIEAE